MRCASAHGHALVNLNRGPAYTDAAVNSLARKAALKLLRGLNAILVMSCSGTGVEAVTHALSGLKEMISASRSILKHNLTGRA